MRGLLLILLFMFTVAVGLGFIHRYIYNLELKRNKRIDELNALNEQIRLTKIEMINVQNNLNNQKINTSTGFNNLVDAALDYYDNLHIQVPADILEDLQYNHFDDTDQVVNFIENQRNYWKLENSKKILKR